VTLGVVITERYHVLHVEVAEKKVKDVYAPVDMFQKRYKKNAQIAMVLDISVKINLSLVIIVEEVNDLLIYGGTVTYVKCQNCNGTGQKDNYVNVACRPCGGSGYSGTETVRERCTRSGCSSGYITGTCNTCNGRTGTVCSKCNGYANIQKDCRRCSGNGFIYVSE
jgi:DnaJ-class molecular chaperone